MSGSWSGLGLTWDKEDGWDLVEWAGSGPTDIPADGDTPGSVSVDRAGSPLVHSFVLSNSHGPFTALRAGNKRDSGASPPGADRPAGDTEQSRQIRIKCALKES